MLDEGQLFQEYFLYILTLKCWIKEIEPGQVAKVQSS